MTFRPSPGAYAGRSPEGMAGRLGSGPALAPLARAHRGGPAQHHRQRGAALLIALVIMTLVTTLAAGMVWQQWRAIQVETAERARAQAAWMLSGASDWARLILSEDGRTQGVDDLGETWAVPLAEARLSSFLAANVNPEADDGGPQAFLSGQIVDLQSRYNLRRLAIPGEFENERKVLRRLCAMAGMAQGAADELAARLAQAWDDKAADGPLRPQSVEQLAWLGVPQDRLTLLAQWATVLPRQDTPVNLNTASREVLMAVIDGLDPAGADRLIARRQSQPFRTLDEARALLPQPITVDPQRLSTGSSYFEVQAQLRLDERILRERTVVVRDFKTVTPLSRERVPLHANLPP